MINFNSKQIPKTTKYLSYRNYTQKLTDPTEFSMLSNNQRSGVSDTDFASLCIYIGKGRGRATNIFPFSFNLKEIGQQNYIKIEEMIQCEEIMTEISETDVPFLILRLSVNSDCGKLISTARRLVSGEIKESG